MSQKVDVRAVLFGYRLDLRVRSAEDMLAPRVVLEGDEGDPLLKVLFLPLDDSGLPLLVPAQLVVGVEAVMIVYAFLLVSLRCVVYFELGYLCRKGP